MSRMTEIVCSFCQAKQEDTSKIIAGAQPDGGSIYICDQCVGLAADIMGFSTIDIEAARLEERKWIIEWLRRCQADDGIPTGIERGAHVPYPQDPECPGSDCPMCSGEACSKCGAGTSTSAPRNCEHDSAERHEIPVSEYVTWAVKDPPDLQWDNVICSDGDKPPGIGTDLLKLGLELHKRGKAEMTNETKGQNRTVRAREDAARQRRATVRHLSLDVD